MKFCVEGKTVQQGIVHVPAPELPLVAKVLLAPVAAICFLFGSVLGLISLIPAKH